MVKKPWCYAYSHGKNRYLLETCVQYFRRLFDITLSNAQRIKNLPGRKTDVSDAEWIVKLLRHGLVEKSFVPPEDIRQLRDLTRYRKK